LITYFKERIFGRLGLLFAFAAFILVCLTYYVINWSVADKDNILDVHDAYYHYQFVRSWPSDLDTNYIQQELDNLKLLGAIFRLDADTLCHEDYVVDAEEEKKLTYWSNIKEPFSFCDYVSYQDSDYLSEIHGVNFPEMVSFGDIYIGDRVYPASVVENSPWQVLLIIDSAYQSEWISFMPIVILSILFMLWLYLVIWRFLRPISLMQNRIIALESGDLDSKIDVIGTDELALLSQNFNILIEQIKQLLQQKERLLSDVSHELKTPLAKIRLLIAMVNPEEKIQQIDKHVDYLDSIITNILISDKLAMPYANLDTTEISVRDLINQAIELSKNKNIKYINPLSTRIKCDTIKIAIVIKNLLDNAEKYAPSNRPVEISTVFEGDNINIGVRDFGPGVDEKLIQKITDPYVRGKDLKQPGFGLGLSICKKVMDSHRGLLKINNMSDEGCCFEISWNYKILKIVEKRA